MKKYTTAILITLVIILIQACATVNNYKLPPVITGVQIIPDQHHNALLGTIKQMYLGIIDSVCRLNKSVVLDTSGKVYPYRSMQCFLGFHRASMNPAKTDSMLYIHYTLDNTPYIPGKRYSGDKHRPELGSFKDHFPEYSYEELKSLSRLGLLCSLTPLNRLLKPKNSANRFSFSVDSIHFDPSITGEQQECFRTLIDNRFVYGQSSFLKYNSLGRVYNYYPNYRLRPGKKKMADYAINFAIREEVSVDSLVVILNAVARSPELHTPVYTPLKFSKEVLRSYNMVTLNWLFRDMIRRVIFDGLFALTEGTEEQKRKLDESGRTE